jgi:hypothetical protein
VDSEGTPKTVTTNGNVVGAFLAKVENAADFESGNSEYLSMTDGAQVGLDISSSMLCILAWIKSDTATGQQGIVAKGPGTTAGSYFIYGDGTNNLVGIVDGTSIAIAGPPDAGILYHFGLNVDGAFLHLPFNGAFDGVAKVAKALPSLSSAHAFSIGARDDSGFASFFDGIIDEVLLAARWFREEEIKAVYNKGLNVKELTSTEEEPDPSLTIRKRAMFAAFPV